MRNEDREFDPKDAAKPSEEVEPDPDVEVLEPMEVTEGCDAPKTKEGSEE